jgi:hypothetical protein
VSTSNTPTALGSVRPSRPTTRYLIHEKLASGGMGTVYRAVDTVTGGELALKRLSHEGSKKKGLITESFEREYQVLASLDHPRIIRVFDYGIDALGAYYTMELIDGEDLRSAAPVPYREACLYLRDVATCLALLHARGLIHRDVSPSNVRKTKDGHCKLLDFGALMAFGRPEVIVGTPPAIPPEALENSPLDQRADLYALGALGYWTLTGQHAYPARQIQDLPGSWERAPPPPSSFRPDVPSELDELILSLLSLDSLARPGSAAEVIARLNVIADLPREDTSETGRLAGSFLLNPRFTGRAAQLSSIRTVTESLAGGVGGAIRIEAASGMGRSRLLEEGAVRAQLAGATVLRADAGMYRSMQGTSRALVLRAFDALPELARAKAADFREPLRALGTDIESRLETVTRDSESSRSSASPPVSLEDWFAEISRVKALAILVDNVEYADDASLALLACLAKLSTSNPLLVIVTERTKRDLPVTQGLAVLRAHSVSLELPPLDAQETRDLIRSLFGDVPNAKRFAEWLHERSAGSPLHAVEIVRQLVGKQVIRYTGGVWTIPFDKPDASLPAALEDVLSMRAAFLSEPARILAECLSLQQEQPTLELCRFIAQQPDDRQLFLLLEELRGNDILHADRDGFRFSSMALSDVLLSGMDSKRLEQNHRRLGDAFSKLHGHVPAAMTLQAGWHLIQGGDELRGADMIARIAADPVTMRTLLANLHRVGRSLEAALEIYGKHRRSIYERLPLLASLAQAGYYEQRRYAERYGDFALDALEHVSGLQTARRLRPFLGRWLSLVFGILFAVARFRLVPRSERQYSFADALTHLFGAVTTCAATAALSLDAERATQVADVLEPFSVLPPRLTPAGIYAFCKGLGEIGRDNEPAAYETFDRLLGRFQDPRYYPSLPADTRKIYIAASHFARGSFAIFRARGQAGLESADALERTDFKLYATIASQLRFLYYMNRGEFAKAAVHREQFELRAAHLGSLWQVETWEAPALILVSTLLSDIVTSTRVAHQLELQSRSVPSLKRYARLATQGLMRSRGDPKYIDMVTEEYRNDVPRSYIGWGATMAFWARGHNELGQHAEAKRVCEAAIAHLTDADREYSAHFLGLDIQLAIADAGLGAVRLGLERIDGLLLHFADCDHPLVHGLLHETRARISFVAGNISEYERSAAQVERWFLPTETPILIAKHQRLVELKHEVPSARPGSRSTAANTDIEASTDLEEDVRTQTLCDPVLATRFSLRPPVSTS